LPLTALCQRDRPEDVGLGPDGAWEARSPGLFPSGHEARPGEEARLGVVLRSGRFWGFVACFFFTPVSMFSVTTHQVAHVVDLGFPKMTAVSILGMVGMLSSVGRVLFAVLSDRVGRVWAASSSYACSASGILVLMLLGPGWRVGWLYLYAGLFGIAFGAAIGSVGLACASLWVASDRRTAAGRWSEPTVRWFPPLADSVVLVRRNDRTTERT
jgi:hypothetical protein